MAHQTAMLRKVLPACAIVTSRLHLHLNLTLSDTPDMPDATLLNILLGSVKHTPMLRQRAAQQQTKASPPHTRQNPVCKDDGIIQGFCLGTCLPAECMPQKVCAGEDLNAGLCRSLSEGVRSEPISLKSLLPTVLSGPSCCSCRCRIMRYTA